MRPILMRSMCLVVMACSVIWAPVRSAEPIPSDDAAARKLIEQLGSKSYRERQQALVGLARLPAAVLARQLAEAAKSTDPEVRRLARELLHRAVSGQETEQLLRPSQIRLTYKGVAVAEALADFARRTGMNVALADTDRARFAGRTIDLDTGEVPFWEAYRQLCTAAGVVEIGPDPAAPPQPSPYADMERRGRRVIWMDGRHVANQPKPEAFVLRAGKADEPTFTSGALRLRILDGQLVKDPAAKETSLRFDVALEPRFKWDRIVSLRLDRAVDSLGQELQQSGVDLGEVRPVLGAGEEVIVIWDGETEMMAAPRPRTTTLALSLGQRPARSIKELRGTLAVQAEAPLETLVQVSDVLRSEKKTFDGLSGSYVKVNEVRKDTTGQYTLRIDVRLPSREADLPIGLGRMVWLNRARGLRADGGILTPEQLEKRGLALRDARGQPLGLVSAKCDNAASPIGPFSYTLVYEWKKDQPEPTTLVLSGRRMVLLEVPFVLRDVPLR